MSENRKEKKNVIYVSFRYSVHQRNTRMVHFLIRIKSNLPTPVAQPTEFDKKKKHE